MSRRIVLCEGPDDLAALREIALQVFGAQRRSLPPAAGAAGDDRRAALSAGRVLVEIKASSGGKSALPKLAATQLAGLPPQIAAQGEDRTKRLAVVFDADGDLEADFHAAIARQMAEGAPDWTLTTVAPGSWLARRGPGERVQVRAVSWRGPGAVVDGLSDHQNLERLLCAVAARAFSKEASFVERWLTEIGAELGRTPGWKAALHLWCALVEEKASETNAATRFLHQNRACKPHVSAVLGEVGLVKALASLLRSP